MTAGNHFDPNTAEPELFSALLTPHRSLNRTGFFVLMVFLSVVSFVAGVAFLLMLSLQRMVTWLVPERAR